MKIVTWNVNGIRSFDNKWKDTICSLDADIICVQETKVTRKSKIYEMNGENLMLKFMIFISRRYVR